MPPPPRRPWRRHPGPGMPPPPPGGGFRRRRRGGGCLSVLLAVCVLIIIVVCAAQIPRRITTDHHRETSASQVHVTPLPSSAIHETAYYTDELGWIGDASALEKSLKKFYSVTGVQPHIYLSRTVLDQSEADSLYSRLFTDEGHFLLVITDDWNTVYILGDDAAGVLTDRVMDLFWENFDDCADSARADEKVLTDTFIYTADGLSSGASREPAAITGSQRRTASFFLILAIVLFLAVVAVIVTVIVRSRKNARHDKAETSRSQGYNLNGEFHTYDEKQDL